MAAVYFITSGWLLVKILKDERGLAEAVQKADADGDGDVTTHEFEAAFGKGSLVFKERGLLSRLMGRRAAPPPFSPSLLAVARRYIPLPTVTYHSMRACSCA